MKEPTQPKIVGTFEPCLYQKRCSGCNHIHECLRPAGHKGPWHRCRCDLEWRANSMPTLNPCPRYSECGSYLDADDTASVMVCPEHGVTAHIGSSDPTTPAHPHGQ
jgi:hypothetical protein